MCLKDRQLGLLCLLGNSILRDKLQLQLYLSMGSDNRLDMLSTQPKAHKASIPRLDINLEGLLLPGIYTQAHTVSFQWGALHNNGQLGKELFLRSLLAYGTCLLDRN